jgi:glutaminyl-peptide cyclotransferase
LYRLFAPRFVMSPKGRPGRSSTPRRRAYLLALLAASLTGAAIWWWPSTAEAELLAPRPSAFPSDQIKADCHAILSAGPRVAGSQSRGVNTTRDLIVGRLQGLGWAVHLDSFAQRTVIGRRTFTNIIAKGPPGQLDRSDTSMLLLAAHYDSKLFHDFTFLGASDSAAPCAMLLDIAANVTARIRRFARPLTLVFFDGEEAFRDWTDTDSLYGARHLAEAWERDGTLSKIGLFVLLDLLGTSDGSLRSLISDSHSHFVRLADEENRLRRRGLIRRSQRHFHPMLTPAHVEDDHVPFLRRGVPVLHLIPIPFPNVWHSARDGPAALHWDTIYDVTLVLTAFVQSLLDPDVDSDSYALRPPRSA